MTSDDWAFLLLVANYSFVGILVTHFKYDGALQTRKYGLLAAWTIGFLWPVFLLVVIVRERMKK